MSDVSFSENPGCLWKALERVRNQIAPYSYAPMPESVIVPLWIQQDMTMSMTLASKLLDSEVQANTEAEINNLMQATIPLGADALVQSAALKRVCAQLATLETSIGRLHLDAVIENPAGDGCKCPGKLKI
ncbi:hypothetical protein [Paraburkholderia sp. BCC1885]|uniref:hypothetical protein n=1 Tax=Paraburkholderia sp. BCC1885 TaxID=2562669 RepID=UPI0011841A32|nr:hypothetical protein [Paraburkholderia sp. BCC1885]